MTSPELPIAIEARALSGPAGGVVRYILGLLSGFQRIERCPPLLLVCDHPSGCAHSPGLPCVSLPPRHPAFRLWWDTQTLPQLVRRAKVRLLHRTKPAGVSTKKGDPPTVVTIYDTIPLDFPDTQTLFQRTYWRFQLPRAARSAGQIVTISEASKQSIVRTLGVPPERVTVTYPGLESAFAPSAEDDLGRFRARYGIAEPYLLTVGTIEPRKNVDLLLRCFAGAARELPHTLLVAGRWGWKTASVKRAARDPRLAGRVKFLGPVPPPDLPLLYGGASLFVSLSRAEGFGFPPLEAMACGTPVISSNRGSLPETVGSAGILVNPDDPEMVSETIIRVATDQEFREKLRQAGLARAKRFTWEDTARATLDVYERALL